ncbi:RnfABCDGE type electron transport complex subunit D [Ruminococcus sp.]|uniref:RnfABCDGE type electron transport complex subunit D n=1 Tax=Ruminococcus sp. TaxID=41978 RepID=UPI0025F13D7E|nr:RnfABCDGE type electron transport complex subunit D [Ruminococcus sp.]
MEKLLVSPSPQIRDNISTSKVMTNVLIALCPALVMSAYVFGGRALMLTGFCMITAFIWEKLCNIVMKRPDTTRDISALVTGMLLAFNLPVTMPYWQAAIGTFVAIVIVKQLFGGLGQNFANPAIVGRIVLMLAFTGNMTHWVEPMTNTVDAVTSATPLVNKSESYLDMFIGRTGGCLGEVSAAALILGGLYLIVRKIIAVHTPLAFIGTVFVFSYLCGEDGVYQILAGGVMLGAFFMATDYVTTPVTKPGKVIFGIGCGIITCVIRFWGSYPEGVSFSILLMNILTPYIDMITRTKPLGAIKAIKNKEASGK